LTIQTFSSVHFTTVHANLIEQPTSSIELVVLKRRLHFCHQERFQMFVTTPIGATSTNFVFKRDLQNFGSTCGSLRKSFWRHDMKNTQPHLKEKQYSCVTHPTRSWSAYPAPAYLCITNLLRLRHRLIFHLWLHLSPQSLCQQQGLLLWCLLLCIIMWFQHIQRKWHFCTSHVHTGPGCSDVGGDHLEEYVYLHEA